MGANASIEQVQEQKQSTLEETALEHQQQVEENDLASLDDLFKEFGQ
jgi:hypothetical protein